MFFSLVVLSIFSLLIGVESDSRLKCTQSAKLDLQLIIDSSGSIGKTNFKLMMQEIADDLIGQFDIGKDKTRVSLFKYSSSDVMKEEFDLDTYTDAASLKKAIKAVKYEHGYTKTGEAMEKALAHYSAKMRKEKETAKACIVFTDGEANDAAKIPAALKAWEKKGVTVFALGIGKRIKDAGLVAITGSKDRFIKVPDFKAIAKAANSLLVKVCKAIPTKPDVINGYQYVENVGLRVLKVHPEKKPWAAAQSACRAEGGELVKVDSKEMNDWLAKQTLNNVWIGATDEGHEGKWTTPDGNPASNSFWYPGEPNNCCGGQNCAVVNFWTGTWGGKGTWDDQGCGAANSFVCQIMVSLKVHNPGYRLCLMKVHPEKKPWAAAQSICRAEGGELVKVDSKATNDWLARQTLDNIWIGATDNGHEGRWTYLDGSPTVNNFWSKGEPNNCCGGQNCAVVNFRNGALGLGGKGTWDDQGCGLANSFVCQIML